MRILDHPLNTPTLKNTVWKTPFVTPWRFFPFFPFLSVFFRFFRFLLFFFPFSSVCFRFIFRKKTGRHRLRDPFCETPESYGIIHTTFQITTSGPKLHRDTAPHAAKPIFVSEIPPVCERSQTLPGSKKSKRSLQGESPRGPARPTKKKSKISLTQGQIPAVWILAAKLPNSELNFALDFFGGSFPSNFSKEKGQKKSTKKSPQNSPGTLFEKFPSDFLQKPFLESLLTFFLTPETRVWLFFGWGAGRDPSETPPETPFLAF